MLDELREAIYAIPTLLPQREIWNSLHITYEPPEVERLWCQFGEYRIFLHKIHPILDRTQVPLYHPHPWPSAVRIVSGHYEHKIGVADKVLCRQELVAGSQYELTDPDTWHSVQPLHDVSHSIMLIGRPFPIRPDMPAVSVPQMPLTEEQIRSAFRYWCAYFRIKPSWI